MSSPIYIDGEPFDESTEHFWFKGFHTITDMAELQKLTQFKNLRSASFFSTNLSDIGLEYVCRVKTIESLNLQSTEISNSGLRHLAKLPRLASLRLKENSQLTNECVPFLLPLKSLVDLQIHGTSIDQEGLKQLTELDGLRDICIAVWDNNYTFDALIEASKRMPKCTILAKGRGEFIQGDFHGNWS